MNANYTWSHCIADFVGRSNAGNSQNVDDTYQDPNNRYRDRANCESDQRHAFNLTSVAETPKFANTALRLVGSGWKLSGIYKKMSYGNLNGANVQSGSRTVTLGAVGSGGDGTAGLDRALIDIASQRPNIVQPNNIYLDTSGRPGTVLVNAAAFATPDVGTKPTCRPALVKDPGDPLGFGTGTLFVRNPDGNLIEFIEEGKGLFSVEMRPIQTRKA